LLFAFLLLFTPRFRVFRKIKGPQKKINEPFF